MHDSPLLAVPVPDATDSADVATHLDNIVNELEPHAIVWCTSSTRPAGPTAGMTIYETDTKKIMVWYPAPISAWKPPWGSAWGVLGIAEHDAADITTVGTITSAAYTAYNSVTVSVVANRLIAVELTIASLATLGGTSAVHLRITAGGARMRGTPVGASAPPYIGPSPALRGYEISPLTGTRAYQWWGKLVSGSAVNIAAPVLMTVMDVGPA